MASASRPPSSMPDIEVRISGGIFLLSLTYWSNWASSARRIASTSLAWPGSPTTASACAVRWSPRSVTRVTRARCVPSTRTFTVPSGSFSICRMVATLPISYRSSAAGSSLAACFWATSRMCFPASIAASNALIDLGRPTNSGITMCGKTTTSRSGSSGSDSVDALESGDSDAITCLWEEPGQEHGAVPGGCQGAASGTGRRPQGSKRRPPPGRGAKTGIRPASPPRRATGGPAARLTDRAGKDPMWD